MKVRHFDLVWLLLLGACSFETRGSNQFEPEVGPTSGQPTTASTTGTDGTGGTPSSSSASVADSGSESTSTPDDTSGTTGTTGTGEATGTSSGTAGPVCGDGNRDPGEVCDDGNDDEVDCTSQCVEPTCGDGEQNGAESDIDCGGTCGACALCEACQDAADCDGTMVCNAASQCVVQAAIDVNWSSNCGSPADGDAIEGLAAGTYQATASLSAGTIWLPPHTPPTTGYFYETFCAGVTFSEMRTPPGQRYTDINTAFNNMESETETFQFAGGNLTCWHEDDNCGDNNGSVAFSIESVCPR